MQDLYEKSRVSATYDPSRLPTNRASSIDPGVDVPTPVIIRERERLGQVVFGNREIVQQLRERLSCLVANVPEVATNGHAVAPEPMVSDLAGGLRSLRYVVEESNDILTDLLKHLEI